MKNNYTLTFDDYFLKEDNHYDSVLESLKTAKTNYLNKGLISKEEFELIKQNDPDQKAFKFTEIMCKWWLNAENENMQKNELTLSHYRNLFFEFINQKNNIKETDINKYLTYNSLAEVLTTRVLSKNIEEINRIKSIKDIEIIYESNELIIIKPLTHRASFEYGNSCTNWCTTSSNVKYWNDYSAKKIDFYYIYDSTARKENNIYVAFAKYPDIDELQDKIDTKVFHACEIYDKKDTSITSQYFDLIKYFKGKIKNSTKFFDIVTDNLSEKDFQQNYEEYLNSGYNIIEDWIDDVYGGFIGFSDVNIGYGKCLIDHYLVEEHTYVDEDGYETSLDFTQLFSYVESNLPLLIEDKSYNTVNDALRVIFNGIRGSSRLQRPLFSYGLIEGKFLYCEFLEYCLNNNLIDDYYFKNNFKYVNSIELVKYEQISIPALLAMNVFTNFDIEVAVKLLEKCDESLFNQKYLIFGDNGKQVELSPYEILTQYYPNGKNIHPKLKKIYSKKTKGLITDFSKQFITENSEEALKYMIDHYYDKSSTENSLKILDVILNDLTLFNQHKESLTNFLATKTREAKKDFNNFDILLKIAEKEELVKNLTNIFNGFLNFYEPLFLQFDKGGYTFEKEVALFLTYGRSGEFNAINFLLNNCQNFITSFIEYWKDTENIKGVLELYKYTTRHTLNERKILKDRIQELFKEYLV
jgi:hypothetical protein